MSSFRVRHATRDDAATVVALVRAFDEAFLGRSDYAAADLEADWEKLSPATHAWLLFDGDAAVAYVQVDDRRDPAYADGYVHPADFGRGVGTALLELTETELSARGLTAIRNGILLLDARANELLSSRGYSEVRRFSQMVVDLGDEPRAPRWPDGVTATAFQERDGEEFHEAYEEAFADHWGHVRRPFEAWRADHMEGVDYAPELWTVVRAGNRIVAGSELMRERNGMAWVSRLFTVGDWRRRGIGEALLYDAFAKFWAEGRTKVGLGVDATSATGADRLYERVGMRVKWGSIVFEKQLA